MWRGIIFVVNDDWIASLKTWKTRKISRFEKILSLIFQQSRGENKIQIVQLKLLSFLWLVGSELVCLKYLNHLFKLQGTYHAMMDMSDSQLKFIFDRAKLLRVPLWIGHCHLFRKGPLKLRLQSYVGECSRTRYWLLPSQFLSTVSLMGKL